MTDLKAIRMNAVDHGVVKHLVAGGYVQGSAEDGARVGDLFLDVDRALSLTTTEFNSALSRLVKSGLVEKLVTQSRCPLRATLAGVRWDDQQKQSEDQRKQSEVDTQTWLRTKLQGGRAFAQYLVGIAEHEGIARRDLDIAYRALGVTTIRGDGSRVFWELPLPAVKIG